MKKYRDTQIDCIKGIAMIAVVLYHLGLIRNGYLGVDAFLVINGYLVMAGVLRQQDGIKNFCFTDFLIKRIIRLQPVLLTGCIFAMLLGYFVMLPDDYEGLAETVVASVCGANNILQSITTHNYWDAVQNFKPLMHTWYLGVLFQFYVVYGIFTYIVRKINKADIRIYMAGMSILTVLSFMVYILPGDPAEKFYYPQYRFWELGAGALLALGIKKKEFQVDRDKVGKIACGSVIAIMMLLFLPYSRIPKTAVLVLMTFCSLAVLFALRSCNKETHNAKIQGGGIMQSARSGYVVTAYTYGIRLSLHFIGIA